MWCILHCALMHMARGSGLSSSPEALLAAAQSRANAGDVAGAEDLLRQVPKQGDVALAATRLQGVCRFAQGDHDGAARFFARVLKAATALPMDHVNLGLALAVYAEIWTSLNGRPYQLSIDPARNLAAVPRSFGPADWIMPLHTKLP